MRKNILAFLAILTRCTVSYARELKVGVSNFKAVAELIRRAIDGVSATFITCFINPTEYTLKERAQINKLREKQNLRRSTISYLYSGICYDTILPQDPGQWHEDYRQALRNAAKYGDKQSREMWKAAELSY